MGQSTMAGRANRPGRTAGDRTPTDRHTRVMSEPLNWATRQQPLGAPPAPVTIDAPYMGIPQPPARPRRPRRDYNGIAIGIVATTLTLLLAATGIGIYLHYGRNPATFNAPMTLTVPNCAQPGYEDITNGTQATLTNTHGALLSVATLDIIGTCHWRATFTKVPAGEKFYGITIGRRGTVQFTEQQLRDGADLTIS